MANILITDQSNRLGSIDLSGVDINDVQIDTLTSSQISASVNGLRLTLHGTFYFDTWGNLSSGSSMNAFSLSYNHSLVVSATGFTVSYADIVYGNLDTVMTRIMAGDDVYTSAYNGDDYIETYAGNDRIKTGTGSDYVDGGTGFDTFVANGASADYDISLEYGRLLLSSAGGERDQLRNIERIEFHDGSVNVHIGGYSADRHALTADGGPGLLYGQSGADTLTGGHQADTLHGGTGNDSLTGGLGNDRLSGDSGADRILAGAGQDTAHGGAEDDRLDGGADADKLAGGSGNDSLLGDHGHDTLMGNGGRDLLEGGSGWDRLKGGGGEDTLRGDDGRDTLMGDAGSDDLSGGNHGDQLQGGGGNDLLRGGNGDDDLSGQSGNDTLTGGNGGDQLSGDGGRDMLTGYKGDDRLTGGKHADTFVFHEGHGNDTITDFTIGIDLIEIGRGASRMKQLEFTQQGDDVLVAFSNVTVLVEDVTLDQLQHGDHFLF